MLQVFEGNGEKFCKLGVRNDTQFENLWSRVWEKNTPACVSMKYIFIK